MIRFDIFEDNIDFIVIHRLIHRRKVIGRLSGRVNLRIRASKTQMAPKGTPKSTPQVQRVILKTNMTKTNTSPLMKSKMTTIKKSTDRTTPKENKVSTTLKRTRTTTTTIIESKAPILPRQRRETVQMPATPKAKEVKPIAAPSSVTKSGAKPSWKRRPKPAHSGVPVPEKMRKLLNKFLLEENNLLIA